MGFYRGPNIVTDGLVYAMDAGSARSYDGTTTLTDLVSSNTGTLNNGVTYQSINGGVFDFDGVDQYISIANSASPQFTANQSFTISYTLKLNSVSGNVFWTPIMKGSFSQSYGHLIINDDLLVYTDADSSPEFNVSNIFTNDANKWVFVTQTYDGSRIYVYRNGEFFGQSGTGIGFTTSTSPLYFGSNNSTGYYLDGAMANLKMYNRALSAAEVTQNFNAQKSRFGL